jgi:GNAT superfamily N-acetyltransferase
VIVVMRDIFVRDVVPGDAEALAPLLDALGYPTSPDTFRERLADLRRADRTGHVLGAFDPDGRALGFITLHSTPVLHRPTAVGRITALVVDPRAHRTGVGRRLVEEGERLCREAGLQRIEVTSGVSHVAAYDFYRHLGYEDHGLRFAKPL